MTGHGRTSSVEIEEELAQIRRYEDFTTTGNQVEIYSLTRSLIVI